MPLDSLPDPALLTDVFGTITAANPHARRWFGGEVVGKPIGLFLPRVAIREEATFTPAISPKNVLPAVCDGRSPFLVDIHRSPCGEASQALYLLRPVSALSLRERDAIIRSFFDAPILMGVVELHDGATPDVQLLNCNAATEAFFQRSLRMLQGKFFSELGTPSAVLSRWVERYREAEQSRRSVYFEYEGTLDGASEENPWFAATVSYVCHGPTGRPRFSYTLEDVTVRRRSEEHLRLMCAAVEHATDVIMIIEGESVTEPGSPPRVVYVNSSLTRATGYVPDEIIGQPPHFLEGPATSPKALDYLRERRRDWQPARVELLAYRKDGSTFWGELDMRPIADPAGRLTHWISILRDTTERKRAEEQLRQSEARYRAAAEGSLDAFFLLQSVHDTAGRIVDFECIDLNARALQLVNIPREKLIGGRLCELIPIKRTAGFFDKYVRVVETGETLEEEFFINVPEITAHWCHQQVVRVGDGIAITSRDITSRKLDEGALLAAEERLRTVLQNIPLVVFGLDSRGVFSFFDGKGLAPLDLHPGDVIGKSVYEIFENESELLRNIDRAIAGDAVAWTSEINGILFQIMVTPLQGPAGQPMGWIGVALDVTERDQLQKQLIHQEKLAALGQMIAGVAHEINNPLAAISGIAQLLDMHPDAAIRADAQTILRMAERANRVVRALLTYARGTEDRARDLHTLPALVDQAMELCAHHLRKADVSMIIRRQPAEEDAQVCVNASQIEQILVNLINNAEHALRSKPADERFIVIASGVEGGMAFLSVTDTGCGIPDTLRQRIFDPFVSTKGIGEGTGLGLSICHGIATAHNGAIEVVSGKGIGSTFTLRLPLASAAPSI